MRCNCDCHAMGCGEICGPCCPRKPFEVAPVSPPQWEIFHDDCGVTLTADGLCPKCGFHPDLQSKVARRIKSGEVAPVSPEPPRSEHLGWKDATERKRLIEALRSRSVCDSRGYYDYDVSEWLDPTERKK